MTPYARTISMFLAAAGLSVAGAASGAGAQSTLVMRGGAAAPAGTPVSCNEQGVGVSPPVPEGAKPAPAATVGWDRIAEVRGALAGDARKYGAAAEQMWRARSRLGRGDVQGAEPIFEELFPAYAWKTGPGSAVVCGGLLSCRLTEGAQTAAVLPWLAYLQAVPDGSTAGLMMPEHEPGMLPAVDGAMQLSPLLPPMWVGVASVQSLARAEWPAGDSLRARTATLAAFYEQAARADGGLAAALPTRTVARGDEAGALVRDVVTARIGDETQRATARQALAARLKKHPAQWVEVWCRVGTGRSLLKEKGRDAQLLGAAELLEVAARFERVVPYLTGLALAESAVALHGVGDEVGATRVRQDLLDRFPGHPATEWEALRSWASVAAPPPKALTTPQPSKMPDNPEGGPL